MTGPPHTAHERMQVEGLQVACDADVAWFKAHPERRTRVRLAAQAEELVRSTALARLELDDPAATSDQVGEIFQQVVESIDENGDGTRVRRS